MIEDPFTLPAILSHSPVRVLFGLGLLAELGQCARAEGARHVLLVTDPGIVNAGYADRARDSLVQSGVDVFLFDGTHENPTTDNITAGVSLARNHPIDFIVGLGGGSAMDCAKGINLILTGGLTIADYWGEGKATIALLPMILIPTTAGTGSEAQSFALISDADTRQKMVCGDRRLPQEGGLRPRLAILDPQLTSSQPAAVAAAAGIDAIAHAVETAGTTRRNDVSRELSKQAWQLLSKSYEAIVNSPSDHAALANMLLGAHLAGAAIEQSMLGAAHACANPLTSKYGIVHGQAVGLLLPHVVRFNCANSENVYADLVDDPETLAQQLSNFLAISGSPTCLDDCGVERASLPGLAALASKQWTAAFNSRQVGEAELLEIYESAFA